MNRIAVGMAVLCLIISGAAVGQDTTPTLRISLRGWWADIDADTSLVKDLFGGGRIDIDDELDIDTEIAPEAVLRLQLRPRHALELRLLYLSYDADETVIRPLLFDDSPTVLFNRLKGDISLAYARFGWRWAIIAPRNGAFRLETMLDVAGGQAKAEYELDLPVVPYTFDEDEVKVAGALPTIGLAATIAPAKWFELVAEASGMTAGEYGHILDYETLARLKFAQWFGIEGGYRGLYIKGSDGDDEAKFDFHGPFAGISLSF